MALTRLKAYKILGVDKNTDSKTLLRKYKNLISSKSKTEGEIQQIKRAYEFLKDKSAPSKKLSSQPSKTQTSEISEFKNSKSNHTNWSDLLNIFKPFPYDMQNINLTKESIQKKINKSQEKYSHLRGYDKSTKSFLWCAIQENKAPIYLIGVQHVTFGYPLKNIFENALKNILDHVKVVYTEIQFNRSSQTSTFFSMDSMIAELAETMGKILKPLESSRIRDMLGIDEKESSRELANFLKDINKAKISLKNLTKKYLSLGYQPTSDSYQVPASRNTFWMNTILKESGNGVPALIVCGYKHFICDSSLIQLLTHEGYTLIPIMQQPPILGNHALRWFERTGNNRFPMPTIDHELLSTHNEKSKPLKGLLEYKK